MSPLRILKARLHVRILRRFYVRDSSFDRRERMDKLKIYK